MSGDLLGVTDSPRSDTDTSQLGVWDPLLPLWDTFNGSVRSKASTKKCCGHHLHSFCSWNLLWVPGSLALPVLAAITLCL